MNITKSSRALSGALLAFWTAAVLAGPVAAADASGSGPGPLEFTRLGSKLQGGAAIGKVRWGMGCYGGGAKDALYRAGVVQLLSNNFAQVVYAKLSAAGYPVLHDPGDLFQSESGSASGDLQIAASIETVSAEYCDIYNFANNATPLKGKVSIGIEWQIFSKTERKIIARVKTSGEGEIKTGTRDVEELLFKRALDANVDKFASGADLRQVIATLPASSVAPGQTVAVKGSNLAPLTYVNKNTGPATVADGVGEVVVIFADNGMGSGFLIGSEGLLLTNRHVVGNDKYVKVRWSDGVEGVGEVLRSDSKRDVALVKTDPRGRAPLRLQTTTPQPGEDVYAIGTPLDEKLQSTVTKGVVSANRTIDGLSFIQSDVAINHGNSGGPLLDKTGSVLGITVMSLQPAENVQIGINLFIPVRDALDFLALKPQG